MDDIVQRYKSTAAKAIGLDIKTNAGDATKKIKEHSAAIRDVTEQSKKAGDAIGGFFQRMDSGKLIMAASTAVMAGFAKTAVDSVEALRVNAANITAVLGGGSGILGFIGQGGQASGTSRQGRSDLVALLAMTGWKDPGEVQKAVEDAEKILHSAFGRGLQKLGVGNEEQLIDALSGNLDPTSKLGRALREKAPELFAQGALEREKLRVMAQPQFASIANTANGQAIITQEAQRNLAKRALTSISGQVEFDPESSATKLDDFLEHLGQLTANVGAVVKPGSDAILVLVTSVLKLLETVPEIPTLIAMILGLGVAFSTLGVVLPLVTGGIETMSVALLANPIGLTIAAVVALIVILGGLEARFKVFSKAWEHFTQSEIGKDLISGLQSLLDSLGLLGSGDFMSGVGQAIEIITSAISGVFDQVDRIYKLAKGGDILGAMKGGMELMIKLSPMGIVLGFLEAFKPSKKTLDEMLVILRKTKDIWDGFINWVRGTFDSIVESLSRLAADIADKFRMALPSWAGGYTDEERAAREAGLKPGDKGWPTSSSGAAPSGGAVRSGQYFLSDTGALVAAEDVDKYRAQHGGKVMLYPYQADSSKPAPTVPTYSPEKVELAGAIASTKDKTGSSFTADESTVYGTPKPIQITPTIRAQLTKNDIGGEVTKSGLAWVDEGEPIVPAEVARSSSLIDLLRGIATGESGREGGGITVNLTGDIVVQTGQGADAYSIARDLKAAVLREFESSEFEGRVEQIVFRKNRGFMG